MGEVEMEHLLDELIDKISEQEKRIKKLERKMGKAKIDKSVLKVLEEQK